jgi:hypothetical protein
MFAEVMLAIMSASAPMVKAPNDSPTSQFRSIVGIGSQDSRLRHGDGDGETTSSPERQRMKAGRKHKRQRGPEL